MQRFARSAKADRTCPAEWKKNCVVRWSNITSSITLSSTPLLSNVPYKDRATSCFIIEHKHWTKIACCGIMNINPREAKLQTNGCYQSNSLSVWTRDVYCNEIVVTFPFTPFSWWFLVFMGSHERFGFADANGLVHWLLLPFDGGQVLSSCCLCLSVPIELHRATEWVMTWFRRSEQLMWRQCFYFHSHSQPTKAFSRVSLSMFIRHNTMWYFFFFTMPLISSLSLCLFLHLSLITLSSQHIV